MSRVNGHQEPERGNKLQNKVWETISQNEPNFIYGRLFFVCNCFCVENRREVFGVSRNFWSSSSNSGGIGN
jgi:hypothetical protein